MSKVSIRAIRNGWTDPNDGKLFDNNRKTSLKNNIEVLLKVRTLEGFYLISGLRLSLLRFKQHTLNFYFHTLDFTLFVASLQLVFELNHLGLLEIL